MTRQSDVTTRDCRPAFASRSFPHPAWQPSEAPEPALLPPTPHPQLVEQLSEKLALEDAVSKLREVLPRKKPLEVKEIVASMQVPNGTVGKLFALYEAVFTGPGGADPGMRLDQMAEKFKLILAACGQDSTWQAGQLIALERLCGVLLPARVREVALVMKVLYEYDIVDDAVFHQWDDSLELMQKFKIPKDASQKVREAAEPFMGMLSDDEDESGDEDESDEDDE